MKTLIKLTAAAMLVGTLASQAFAADVFVIEPNHSFPRFSYSHFGMSTQISRFNSTKGKIVLDAAAKTGSVEVEIDMKSVDTGSTLFNGHIQGEDFLDTAKYPTATFKSTAVRFEGDKPVAVDGTLTIKGVSKPVTLKVTSFNRMNHPMNKKDWVGADAVTVIKRSDFKADKYVPNVGDEVTITIAVEALHE